MGPIRMFDFPGRYVMFDEPWHSGCFLFFFSAETDSQGRDYSTVYVGGQSAGVLRR